VCGLPVVLVGNTQTSYLGFEAYTPPLNIVLTTKEIARARG